MANYTVVPSSPPTLLPITPNDGQIFLDHENVQWRYNIEQDIWLKYAAIEVLPLATETNSGLMSGAHKTLLNNVPTTPGGFGIVIPHSIEPIVGDIELLSNSLNIECVTTDNQPINPDCVYSGVACEGLLNNYPGFNFSLSHDFLNNLVVNFPGQAGPRGVQGVTGPQGALGWSLGPKGIQGTTGIGTTVECTLGKIIYQDIPGVTDKAIVNLQINQDTCTLQYTVAKIQMSNGPAQELVATPLTRSIGYPNTVQRGNCDVTARLNDWILYQPSGDTTPLNMQLVRLAKNANIDTHAGNAFNTYPLVEFINDIVDNYQTQLEHNYTTWESQVKTYVQAIDNSARDILSGLANELAQCEFNLPAQVCVSITPKPTPPPPATMILIVPTCPLVEPVGPTTIAPTPPPPPPPPPPIIHIPIPVPIPVPVVPAADPCLAISSNMHYTINGGAMSWHTNVNTSGSSCSGVVQWDGSGLSFNIIYNEVTNIYPGTITITGSIIGVSSIKVGSWTLLTATSPSLRNMAASFTSGVHSGKYFSRFTGTTISVTPDAGKGITTIGINFKTVECFLSDGSNTGHIPGPMSYTLILNGCKS